MQGRVAIFVSDNASTDDTSAVTVKYGAILPNLTCHRNVENLGADFNIGACFSWPNTPYVWILGDDDAPLKGSISRLVDLLDRTQPDLVYLSSVGRRSIADDYATCEVTHCRAVELSRERFASIVNVQLTFISGVVIRKDAASPQSIASALDITSGTSLIQLAWTYEILKQGRRFSYVNTDMLMATAGNSGGYAVLKVFLVNHTRIAQALLGDFPEIARRILARTSSCYLPGLLWNIRTKRMGQFDLPRPNTIEVPAALSHLASYRFVVSPIWRSPKVIAWAFFQFSRFMSRSNRIIDKIFFFH
jgi:glycosyltransferase involved in cell wall biosynthesis